MISEIAKRYAKALFSVTEQANESARVLADLHTLAQAVTETPEIKAFFASPVATINEKTKVLSALKGKVAPSLEHLLDVLTENERLEFVVQIAAAFEALIDAKNGRTRGLVKSATELTAEQRKSLETTIKKATGQQVILQFEVDPTLVGGLVAKVGGWTFDDSLTSHLASLKEHLANR